MCSSRCCATSRASAGLDDLNQAVERTGTTDQDGLYQFRDLRPGAYFVTQVLPEGYDPGLNSLGTLDGQLWGDISEDVLDQFFVEFPFAELEHVALDPNGVTDAINFNFGNRPPAGEELSDGQTASIGFWNNRHGQNLIRSLNGGAADTQLGDWLAATAPNLFGGAAGANNLAGKSNVDVAAFFQSLFSIRGQKLEAQVMATALAVYVTNSTLAGTAAEAYGFTVTTNGVGTALFNVGDSGAAFEVADGTEMTVLDLLITTDRLSYGGILYYDEDSAITKMLRNLANQVYSEINQGR